MIVSSKLTRLISGGILVLSLYGFAFSDSGLVMQSAVAKGQIENVTVKPDVCDEKIGNKIYQTSKILVNTSIDQIWPWLIDYKNAASNFPTVKKCQVIEDKGNVKKVAYSIQPSGYPFVSYDYVLEVKNHPKTYIEWRRIGGDFKDVQGFWKLEPLDGGRSTMVTYGTYLVADFLTPAFLVKKSVKQDLPGVMLALKSHAERDAEVAGRPTAGKNE